MKQGNEEQTFFLKKRANPGLFFVYFRSFSNKHYYNFYNRLMWKNVMSIQYMAPGFEPTTFATWVSSQNHKTRAPAQTHNLLAWKPCAMLQKIATILLTIAV